jgi:hypothetical protein
MVGMIIAFPGIVSRDKEVAVDLDKVKIEMPADMPGSGPTTDPFAPSSGNQPAADPTAAASGAQPSGDDEQKKMDELFGTPKK